MLHALARPALNGPGPQQGADRSGSPILSEFWIPDQHSQTRPFAGSPIGNCSSGLRDSKSPQKLAPTTLRTLVIGTTIQAMAAAKNRTPAARNVILHRGRLSAGGGFGNHSGSRLLRPCTSARTSLESGWPPRRSGWAPADADSSFRID